MWENHLGSTLTFSSTRYRIIANKGLLESFYQWIDVKRVWFSKNTIVENNFKINSKLKFHFLCQNLTSVGLKRKIVENSLKKNLNKKNNMTIVILAQNRA